MAKNVDNHSAGSGNYDGGDPDAEIKRLAAEENARELQRQQDEARRAQQERDARGGK
jgi:hypothetical protein